MKEGFVERRRCKRHAVKGIRGNVRFLTDLKLIDISVSGAAIETKKRLDVNREYNFKIDHKGIPLNVKGLVVWSLLIRSDKTEAGDLVPIYRSGVKFIDSLDEKTTALVSFIEEGKVRTLDRRVGGVRCKITTPQNIKVGYPCEYVVKKISLSGMEIETEHPIDSALRHEMKLILNEEVLTLTGRVVTRTEVPSENGTKYHMGVEFIEISDKDEELLRHFLDTLRESQVDS